jgi:hypothetical protein
VSKKNKTDIDSAVGIQGGHRDAAERLSVEYYLLLGRTNYPPMPQLLDMDELTLMLGSIDPLDLLTLLMTPFGQGFLMGILHQTYLVDEIAKANEDDEEG